MGNDCICNLEPASSTDVARVDAEDRERLRSAGIDQQDIESLRAAVDTQPPLSDQKFDSVAIYRPLLAALLADYEARGEALTRLAEELEARAENRCGTYLGGKPTNVPAAYYDAARLARDYASRQPTPSNEGEEARVDAEDLKQAEWLIGYARSWGRWATSSTQMERAADATARVLAALSGEGETARVDLIEWLQGLYKEADREVAGGATTHPDRAFGRRFAYGKVLQRLLEPAPSSASPEARFIPAGSDPTPAESERLRAKYEPAPSNEGEGARVEAVLGRVDGNLPMSDEEREAWRRWRNEPAPDPAPESHP